MALTSALKYQVIEGWEQLPRDYVHRDVAGVAVGFGGRVFLICRGDHPIIVYSPDGKFLRSWGEGEFTYRTHGISGCGPDNMVYCTDDGNHTVRKFHAGRKALDDLGYHEHAFGYRLRRQGLDQNSEAGGPVRSRPQSGHRPQRRPLHLRRLWQLPSASLLPDR